MVANLSIIEVLSKFFIFFDFLPENSRAVGAKVPK